MDSANSPLQTYPVQITLRVMGEDRDDFSGLVFSLVSRHVAGLEESDLRARPSRAGRYVSISVTFTVLSQEQLDAVYRELGTQARILMVL
jgi:uncharacterized protein